MDIVLAVMAFYAAQYFYWDKVKLSYSEKIVTAIILTYLAYSFLMALLHDHPWSGIAKAGNNLGFIAVVLLLPVLRRSPLPAGGKLIRLAFPLAGILIAVFSVFEIFYRQDSRAELLLGNPLLLSYLAGTTALLSLAFAISANGTARAFSFIGFAGGIIGLMASGGRGPIIAFAVVTAIYFIILLFRLNTRKVIATTIGAILIFGATFFVLQDVKPVKKLGFRTLALVQAMMDGKFKVKADESTRIRISFYQTGYQLFLSNPLFGQGQFNTMNSARKIAPPSEKHWYDKSHLHNAYLTELVSSGIFGLLALIALTFTSLIAVGKTKGPQKDAAALFTLFTTLCFMTNIGFYHDIMVFYFGTILLTLNWLANGKIHSISTQ